MCMWSGRNKAWNVSCNLASHGYPIPNASENTKPQCHNENSFIYIIIEYNQHLVGEKRKRSPNTQLPSWQTVSWHNQSAAYVFTYDFVRKSKGRKKKKTFKGREYGGGAEKNNKKTTTNDQTQFFHFIQLLFTLTPLLQSPFHLKTAYFPKYGEYDLLPQAKY